MQTDVTVRAFSLTFNRIFQDGVEAFVAPLLLVLPSPLMAADVVVAVADAMVAAAAIDDFLCEGVNNCEPVRRVAETHQTRKASA